jgi:hypothetical protein
MRYYKTQERAEQILRFIKQRKKTNLEIMFDKVKGYFISTRKQVKLDKQQRLF